MTRVAVLSSAEGGGAGRAAARLVVALREAGVDVDLADGPRLPADIAPPDHFGLPGATRFSLERPGFVRADVVDGLAAYDLVNVHFAAGIVAVGELCALARRRPVVLTLHDFNAVTGGCHYPGPCTGWRERCIACPQLDRSRASLLVPPQLRAARRELLALPGVSVTAPSRFLLAAVAAATPRAHLLRNPFAPPSPPPVPPRSGGRAPRILLVADSLAERRKNVALAVAALGVWRAAGGAGVVDLVGAAGDAAAARLTALGVPHVAHGALGEAALAEVMAGAAVVLLASSEDNWPNVLVEAGAFGATAVVGPGHGAEEFARRYGGVVAAGTDAAAFAAALAEAFAVPAAARAAAAAAIRAEHAPAEVAARFRALFLTPNSAPASEAGGGVGGGVSPRGG